MRAEPSLADDEPPASGSASCAPATLDEPSGHSAEREIEDVPQADGDEDEDPFTEDEVLQMHEEIRELAAGMYTNKEELDNFLGELDSELQENGDLQERGHILLDVLEYLQNPDAGEEGDEGGDGEYDDEDDDPAAPQPGPAGGGRAEADGDDGVEPYPGEEGLQELWKELQEVCSEDDIKRLEEELEGKQPEEQWKILMEVYEYLSEEQEQERQEFDDWQPSKSALEKEWKEMMARVPSEDVDEVQADWKKASHDEKKQMVWDVRKLLNDGEDEDDDDAPKPKHMDAPKPPPKGAPPPPRGGYKDDSKSEVRRRGGGARRPEHEDLEYDFERAPDGGDWDEYYNKEARRSKGGGRPYVLIGGSLLLLLLLALLLTATMLAEEDQSVMQSAMGLIGLAQPAARGEEATAADVADIEEMELEASD